jgi:hypothetical protein
MISLDLRVLPEHAQPSMFVEVQPMDFWIVVHTSFTNDKISDQEMQVAEEESCFVNGNEVEFSGKMRSSWMYDG